MIICLKRFCKTAIVTFCSIVLAAIVSVQMVAFADFTTIPSNLRGMYETSANSRYVATISKDGTSATFKGYLYDAGDIVAAYPDSIFYQPVSNVYTDNFVVTYAKHAVYNSQTKQYDPQAGEVVFRANLNPKTAEMHVLIANNPDSEGRRGYYNSENYHVYRKV